MKRIRSICVVFAYFIFSCSGGNNRVDNENLQTSAEIPAAAIHALENEEDLDVLLEEIGEAKIVLLGEASHGTSEFYTWRSRISQRLITEKGFNIIGIEGDWSDAYPLNNYIKGNSSYASAKVALQHFDRWPEWMWNNREIEELAEWLRNNNAGKPATEQTGFYGIDVYGIWESLDAIIAYLDRRDTTAAAVAREVQACFAPYNQDEQAYARATVNSSADCSEELENLLESVQVLVAEDDSISEEEFNAVQNTLVVANAEHYYRTAAVSSASSWNIRDRHMNLTIKRLMDYYGPEARIIVWEHNTHVGDARATDMANSGMVNVGQLVREENDPSNVYIVGFGTYKGEVLAARSWGEPVQVMNVPNARKNSWEWILHNQGPPNKIIFMEPLQSLPFYQSSIGHRAIGVVYNPQAESGNYVPSVLPQRYDAFIFIDETTALTPLE